MHSSDFDAVYLNMLDQIDHVSVLAARQNGINKLRSIIEKLWPNGHPTRFVHVAGTNGKGSVCKFLEAGFALLGHAGSLTGPHLFDYRERISINGKFVTRKELVAAWEDIVWPLCVEKAGAGQVVSYSEISILLGLVVFDRRKVKWAALETGCGGRYDSRMALDVEAAVLTNVGGDHPKTLGATLWQRAIEKAGIARKDKPFITSVTDGIALKAVEQITEHCNAELLVVGKGKIKAAISEIKAAVPSMPEGSLLHSSHQQANAALALATVTRLTPSIDRAKMLRSLSKLSYGGRFHKVDDNLYVDVAHNPDKILALAKEMKERFAKRKIVFVLGVSNARDGFNTFSPLLDIATEIVVTQPLYKGVSVELLAASLQPHLKKPVIVEGNPAHAVLRARSIAEEIDGMVMVTGSMYMIDQALNENPYVRHINGSYGWRFPENKDDMTLPVDDFFFEKAK